MPVGTVVYQKSQYATVKLLEGQAAANSPPALATDGADISSLFLTKVAIREGSILIRGVSSGGALAGTFRLWGYSPEAADWFPLGTGTDAVKGTLNAGVALGETSSDKIVHAEPLEFAGHFTRLYLELIAPAGTSPLFAAWFVAPRNIAY